MMKTPTTPHKIKNNRKGLAKRTYTVKLFFVFHIAHLIIIPDEVVFCEIIWWVIDGMHFIREMLSSPAA